MPTGGGKGRVNFLYSYTYTWWPSLCCVERAGSILVCGVTAEYDPPEDLRYSWSFELQVTESNRVDDENLTALMDRSAAGLGKPGIKCVLPLAQAREGWQLMQERPVIGHSVMQP